MLRDIASTEFEDFVLVTSHAEPVVVDFSVVTPRPCLLVDAFIDRESDVRRGLGFVRIVVPDWAAMKRLGLTGLPTLRVYRRGDVIAELLGWKGAEVTRRFLDSVDGGTTRARVVPPRRPPALDGSAEAKPCDS